MKYTENYRLSKPEGSDNVAAPGMGPAMLNDNADIIDAALKAHDTQLFDVENAVANAQTAASNATIAAGNAQSAADRALPKNSTAAAAKMLELQTSLTFTTNILLLDNGAYALEGNQFSTAYEWPFTSTNYIHATLEVVGSVNGSNGYRVIIATFSTGERWMRVQSWGTWQPWVQFGTSANMATQAEAEAGTLTDMRSWSPQRVRQAFGKFGLGANLNMATDANNAKTTGMYYCQANRPAGAGTDGTLFVMSYDSNLWVTQIFQDWRANTLWTRVCNNGAWTAWDKQVSEASGNAASSAKVELRPMTADLHQWVPFGSTGLFVGEGSNIANAPDTGWWRYICICHGNGAGYMTIIATSLNTTPQRLLMKMCSNGAWVGWTELLKFMSSTTDLTAGSSALSDGVAYFVYE